MRLFKKNKQPDKIPYTHENITWFHVTKNGLELTGDYKSWVEVRDAMFLAGVQLSAVNFGVIGVVLSKALEEQLMKK